MKNNTILTLADIRNNNRTNTLYNLMQHDEMSLKELSALCFTSVVTLSKIIDPLVEKGIITAKPKISNRVGRHGLLYSINLKQGFFACFDATSSDLLRLRLYDVCMKEIQAVNMPVPDGKHVQAFLEMVKQVKQFGIDNKLPVLGAALSVLGSYDANTHKVISEVYSWYDEIDFHDVLSNQLKAQRVIIGRYVSFAALAESVELTQTDSETVTYVHIGKTMAGAIVIGNTVNNGLDGLAGNLGHTLVPVGIGEYKPLGEYLKRTSIMDSNGEPYKDKLLLIAAGIYDCLWMLNTHYFIIATDNDKISAAIYEQVLQLKKTYNKDETQISTRLSVSTKKDSHLRGMIEQLLIDYIASL